MIQRETRHYTSSSTRTQWMGKITSASSSLETALHNRTIWPPHTTSSAFANSGAMYKGELDQFHGQTRIETVAWIDPGMIRDLKRADIHTVELMASMGDGAIEGTGMIGLFDLRKRAQQHLAETAKSPEYSELKDQNASLASQIKELQDQMQAQMEGQAAKAPEGAGPTARRRGPGRPRKVDA